MNGLTKTAAALAASAAIALTLNACSSDDGSDNNNSSGGGTIGSEGSYTVNNINDYRTVEIGGQIWMAENLNYYVAGSLCNNNNSDNCNKYGRLYDWATAMGLPSSCNSDNCASQVSAKHQGICPSGWHIPSGADWQDLMNYVDGTSHMSPENSSKAGTKLKAMDGWYSYSGVPNGTDEVGFAALPGGSGYSDGSFGSAGDYGIWWSSSEYDASYAYSRDMYYLYEGTIWDGSDKSYFFSIRCLQD